MENISYPLALSRFEENLDFNVDPILSIYSDPAEAFSGPEPFYNSSILILTSYWESFCVDLIIEASSYFHFIDSFEKLPESFKKRISLEIKNDKHEFSGWKLAGDNWKKFIQERASQLKSNNKKFENGKPYFITEAFNKYLGVILSEKIWDIENFESESELNPILEFIEIRNEIAHEGGSARLVEKNYPFFIREALVEVAKKLSKAIDKYFVDLTEERFYEYEKITTKKLYF